MIVYDVLQQVAGSQTLLILGSLTSDGTLGPWTESHVTDFRLHFYLNNGGPFLTFAKDDNLVTLDYRGGIEATPTELLFHGDDPDPFFSIRSGSNGWQVDTVETISFAGVTASRPVGPGFHIAIPEPSSLALLFTGLLLLTQCRKVLHAR